jgi:hypothetical protein
MTLWRYFCLMEPWMRPHDDYKKLILWNGIVQVRYYNGVLILGLLDAKKTNSVVPSLCVRVVSELDVILCMGM